MMRAFCSYTIPCHALITGCGVVWWTLLMVVVLLCVLSR